MCDWGSVVPWFGGGRLESGLLVLGISHHTAPVEIREKFSIGESRLYPSLHRLAGSAGIEEAVLLSTCNRTEFILWCADMDAASSSVESLLAEEFSLGAEEYQHFYRYTGGEALMHVFRVAASLDSLVVGEPQIVAQVKSAWAKARQAGTTGRYLDRVFQKALSVSKHVRSETEIGDAPVSIPYAAVALARRLFSSLEKRNVMLIGSGKMSELSARYLVSAGVGKLWVTNRTHEHAESLARELGGAAVRFEDRWPYLAQADIILSSTGCPHVILGREDAERIRRLRDGRPVFLIDIAVPRDIDPAVREVSGFFLYDIDDLQQVAASHLDERLAAAAEAEKMVEREAKSFAGDLEAQHVVPTIVALRARLEQIRQAELDRFRRDAGDGADDARAALEAMTSKLMDRVAGELARELKQAQHRPEQEELTAALRHLFHLGQPKTEPAPKIEPQTAPAGLD